MLRRQADVWGPSAAFYKCCGESSTDHPLGSNRTRRIYQLLITETRKAESSFSTLSGDQNTLPLKRKGRFVTMSAPPPAPGIAAAMPALCLPPPPYSPSSPFPASSLSYNPSIPTPVPTSHPTLFILKVHATALTRGELTWSETLSPQRRTPAIPGHDICSTIVALPAKLRHIWHCGGSQLQIQGWRRSLCPG
jgi:hypothetical protein